MLSWRCWTFWMIMLMLFNKICIFYASYDSLFLSFSRGKLRIGNWEKKKFYATSLQPPMQHACFAIWVTRIQLLCGNVVFVSLLRFRNIFFFSEWPPFMVEIAQEVDDALADQSSQLVPWGVLGIIIQSNLLHKFLSVKNKYISYNSYDMTNSFTIVYY